MQEVTTIPGKTYAVECAGEVVITNNETGAIAAQGDGSGQVLFTACGNSYSVSDDTAKVVALFKLAPRLKLTLLQGVAGGLLPKGYTELEYLWSSGTQWIDTKVSPIGTEYVYAEAEIVKVVSGFKAIFGSSSASSDTLFDLIIGGATRLLLRGCSNAAWVDFEGGRFTVEYTANAGYINGVKKATLTRTACADLHSMALFTRKGSGEADTRSCSRICSFIMKNGDAELVNMIPVLRDSDGVPGMWDKVSKQFFTNAGKGTFGYRIKRGGEPVAPMSLRDPWRVAPSGVYGRLVAENALEILADTEEISGDGWEWFANTGEAYEGFGVVPEEDFN